MGVPGVASGGFGQRNVLMATAWPQCITLYVATSGGFNGELGQPSSWVTSPRQVSGPVREVGPYAYAMCEDKHAQAGGAMWFCRKAGAGTDVPDALARRRLQRTVAQLQWSADPLSALHSQLAAAWLCGAPRPACHSPAASAGVCCCASCMLVAVRHVDISAGVLVGIAQDKFIRMHNRLSSYVDWPATSCADLVALWLLKSWDCRE